MTLKYYEKMWKKFRTEYDYHISDKEAIKVCKKLARHFKIPLKDVRFYGKHRGMAYTNYKIRIPHKPSIGIICHELAHLFNYQKYHNWYHNKRLLRTEKKFVNYCRKKQYWNLKKKKVLPF